MSGPVWVGLAVLAVLLFQVGRPLYRRQWRARLMSQTLTPEQRGVIDDHVPLSRSLPDALRRRHEGLICVFLAEKNFVGCAGLQVTDEMRWSIAAQACLLLINRYDGCFDDLRTVLIYPAAFYVEHDDIDESGVARSGRRLLSGESWSEGQVIVSWADAQRGGALAADGHNVVIHEFAHQLDGADGDVNGAPVLDDSVSLAEWSSTMRESYTTLVAELARGEHGLIDAYGATHPAEFFAVVSEVFFEQPGALRQQHPSLYRCLRAVYRIDPADWR